ncbi:MAG: serine--tRNA ligase [Bacteroidota bacterium]
MLAIHLFRQNKELILEGLKKRNFKDLELVDKIIQLDEARREAQLAYDNHKAKINAASKEIGKLKGKDALLMGMDATTLMQEIEVAKVAVKQAQDRLEDLEKELHEHIVLLPNIPHSSVPFGRTPEDNEVVRMSGNTPDLSAQKLPHWELTTKYGLIDFELGTKITGSGFPVYIGAGAKLQRALISYFLDYNTNAGYKEYYPPYMVNAETAYGTGQLPDKEGQMYYMPEDKFYMIPTAEVPVTNIYRDTIVAENDLPVKMTAYTPCFRREAGSYGKDVRGLNRVHQFDKVEIVQLSHPENSYHALEGMVLHVEQLLQSLGLQYRILRLCGGDMGFTSALTYDFEVYSAAQERWLEVSSVSNFETFQTNRMKIRYKDTNGKTQLLHSLNGSSLALPRILACILENNQTPEGVHIPKVLQDYFGKAIIN